ncbi:MAG: lipocalin-like domain-containing protein [Methanobacterium sp.]
MESVIGTWRLKSFKQRFEEGDLMLPFGENPEGILIYDKDGYMSVIISKSDRKDLSIEDLTDFKEEEKISLSDNFIAYSGTYEISDGKIIHHVEISFIPNWVGNPLERFYNFENGKLILTTPPEATSGKKFVNEIIWEKL